MSDYRKRFAVHPGKKVSLSDYDPADRDKHTSHKAALPEIQQYLEKMDGLQYLMYAEHKHSLLIVLQGLDTAGKDGLIRHVLTGMNPQGCKVAGFKPPTAEELDHDFLWRIHHHAPRKGTVAIFNRSHYEEVLVPRVHKLIPHSDLSKRYDRINDFEKLLRVENSTSILKFFLHISKQEQLSRFKERLDDPGRNWKISESDYKEREFWDDYTEAYEHLLQKTTTKHAPWFIIPSDHKWFRNLAISQIITRSLEDLGMKQPASTVDIAEIKRKYHRAVADAKSKKNRRSANQNELTS